MLRITRRAISPRLATRTVSNTAVPTLRHSPLVCLLLTPAWPRAGGRPPGETSGVALVTIVLVLAALIGVAAGGGPGAPPRGPPARRAPLLRVPLTGWPLLAAAAACQVAGSLVARASGASPPYEIGSLAAALLLGGFLARNTRLPGVPLVAAGLLLNLVA